MKKALVITSFGTSVPEARAGITAVEEALADAVPGCPWVRAFTSPTIRRILAGRGEAVPSLPEALADLRNKGARRVVVQPTHLLYGLEYDKLKAGAEALSGGFETLAVGRPLLADTGDIRRFARCLSRDCPAEAGGAVVSWATARSTSPTRPTPPSRPPSAWRAGRTSISAPWRAGRDSRTSSGSWAVPAV